MHILDPRCVYVKHYFRHYLQYLRSIKPLAHSICAVFVQYPAVFLGGISAVFHSIRIVFHSILQYLHSICSCLTVQYYSIAYPQWQIGPHDLNTPQDKLVTPLPMPVLLA